jgi:hypothetical protein
MPARPSGRLGVAPRMRKGPKGLANVSNDPGAFRRHLRGAGGIHYNSYVH